MCSLRDVVIFLAGAAFFHTLSHVMLPMFVQFPMVVHLPMVVGMITLSSMANIGIIVGSALLTVALLWWACRLGRKS